MDISVRESNGIQLVSVTGRLTIGTSSERLHEALRKLAENGARKIVLNLDGVAQMDTTGIAALVRNSLALARAGGELRLVCGAGRVRDALTITRLVEAIPTFETEAAALADFA